MLFALRFLLIPVLLLFFHSEAYSERNCEVLKYVTYCEIINNKLITTDSIVIQINDRSGEIYTDDIIKLNYSKDNPITFFSAWIEGRDGQIVRYLKNKEVTDAHTVSALFYSDYFTKSFILKHTEYPYRICYTYRIDSKQFLCINDWDPVIRINIPTIKARLVLKYPEDYAVKILQHNVVPPVTTVESGIVTKIWNSSYDGRYDDETYSPETDRFLPNILIVPENFTYGIRGSMASWQQFGEWQQKLIDGLDELPEAEKQYIAKAIGNTTNKRDIIRTLYHYLQDHTRYVAVFIDIGGLKPYPASYVAENRFGDCKALTIYMKALLKFAGINSFYVLVNANFQPEEMYLDFPSPQFNHVMLAVPLDNDTIWLENTDNSNPFGYVGTSTQNRPGLLIDGSNSRFVHIPSLTEPQIMESCSMKFTINNEGDALISTDLILRGYSFEFFSSVMASSTFDLQNEYVHDFLPFASFELQDWNITKKGRDAGSLMMHANISVTHLAKKIGGEYYFSYQPLRFPSFEAPVKRKLSVQIPFPVHKMDTLVYQIPEYRKIITEIADKTIQSNYGSYTVHSENVDQGIIIYRDFQLFPAVISIEEYPGFYSFINLIKEEEKNKILYK